MFQDKSDVKVYEDRTGVPKQKVLDTETEDPSSVWEQYGENWLPQGALCSPHMCTHMK